MRRFSAQYIITGTGSLLKRGIITTDDDGTIRSVTDTGGDLKEEQSTEFYNGVIIPGLINCHCHLELSHMKDVIPAGTGLGAFLMNVNRLRSSTNRDLETAIGEENARMAREGIVAVGDICNTADTFAVKKQSQIKYISFLEVFGIDPALSEKRIADVVNLAKIAKSNCLPYSIVPHSVYSLSASLLRRVKDLTRNNDVTTVHFMESDDETAFISSRKGPIAESYINLLGKLPEPEGITGHTETVLNEITESGSLILVHCTVTGEQEIKALSQRKRLYYCLCPGSNLYISGKLPPVNLLTEHDCKIVLGTDSLSSNTALSLLEEMKILQFNFTALTLKEITGWATLNGAEALGLSDWAGSIEPGKRPGLILLENVDLDQLKLKPETTSVRLI
jgi:cytosine/adenosine deaminase-related metal-dependent hydrolase